MAVISKIGRKSPGVRLLLGSIYALLIVGAATMIYPFLLMVAGSTKSAVDAAGSEVIPPFLVDDEALYKKYAEALFNESVEMLRTVHRSEASGFITLKLPPDPNIKQVEEWKRFLDQTEPPHFTYALGFVSAQVSRGVLPHLMRIFKKQLINQFDGDIDRMNKEMGMTFVNWNAFYLLPEDYLGRGTAHEENPFYIAFRRFKEKQPYASRYYFSVEGFYKSSFLKTQYTKDIQIYNEEHGTDYSSWKEIHLCRCVPGDPKTTELEREDWDVFVRTILNLHWLRADQAVAPLYRKFLQAKYRKLDALNTNYGTSFSSFAEVPFPQTPPEHGLPHSDWEALLQGWKDPDTGDLYLLPLEALSIQGLDFQYQDYLRKKFQNLAALNESLGTSYENWVEILPPQQDLHMVDFQENKGWLKREFATRNYLTVFDYIVLHGRGILNTVIYCTLAITAALTVNPLAAYALSRYKPPSAYKVLLFLMLTMAFPPMVTQIPSFLMLRKLGLLNTFWALILPGLANGYSIFLLKGFFDSLPQELYESAEIDGAGEFRVFWQITISLSKPILAVIALNAFRIAYSNFMFALLICQDEKMWTLMPWLYQLQQRSGQGVVFASLMLAAIPTFLMFAFCQNVIMRGIVVPVEK